MNGSVERSYNAESSVNGASQSLKDHREYAHPEHAHEVKASRDLSPVNTTGLNTNPPSCNLYNKFWE